MIEKIEPDFRCRIYDASESVRKTIAEAINTQRYVTFPFGPMLADLIEVDVEGDDILVGFKLKKPLTDLWGPETPGPIFYVEGIKPNQT